MRISYWSSDVCSSYLTSPRSANSIWVAQDQQRNVDSVRVANRTSFHFGETPIDLGAFYNNRHVKHPIFQWLDFTVDDYGAFIRAVDDRSFEGFRNRLIVGPNLQNGPIDTEQFVNLTGAVQGELAGSMADQSRNLSLYAEAPLLVSPGPACIAEPVE